MDDTGPGDAGVPPSRVTEEAAFGIADLTSGDSFGVAVSVSADGTRAIVGAPGFFPRGTARVFLRSGGSWMEEATLAGAATEQVGGAVGISGDGSRAIVRGPQGLVLFFVRTGTAWALEQRASLQALDDTATQVVLDDGGSRAFVGVSGHETTPGVDSGSVLVFVRTGATWASEAELAPALPIASQFFGASISVSADGSRALIGAPGDDTGAGLRSGTAHVWLRTGTAWSVEAALSPSDSAAEYAFGTSVALSADGSVAFVGAPGENTGAGSVRVFARSGAAWVEDAVLTTGDAGAGDRLGTTVAIDADGTHAFFGATGDDTSDGMRAGSVRLFRRLGAEWGEDTVIRPSDAAAEDGFGRLLAVSGDGSLLLVGMPADGAIVGAAGSVRPFQIER